MCIRDSLFAESSKATSGGVGGGSDTTSDQSQSKPTQPAATHALLPIRYSALGYQTHIRSLFGIDDNCRVVNENAPILKYVVPNVFNSMWESDTYGNTLYHQFIRRGKDQSAAPQTPSPPDNIPANITAALRVKLLVPPSARWTDCSSSYRQ
eukprot:TRINITY_DN51922_c0_g1_i1.p1 TRINITY_DN51922_c0_g1~~TRINITY_DN51922_c0_g1_i1.p1  ORF type:complete len:152 (+),score=4.01 TRINITY_DN51922_c0_g1_i1:116-571(+)